MIGKIGPLVQGGSEPRRTMALHLLGGALGGATAAVVLLFAGVVLHLILPRPAADVLALGIPLALLVWGAVDLGVLRLPVLTSDRQTPGEWSCTLGPRGAMFSWGFDLGLVVRTRIPYQTVLALVAYPLLSGDVWSSLAVLGSYGAGKAAAVAAFVLAFPGDFSERCISLEQHESQLGRLVGGSACAIGTFLLATQALF